MTDANGVGGTEPTGSDEAAATPAAGVAVDADHREVVVVGGGVAGLTAATFTARAGLDTLVVEGGESILRRNAHLENVPGFPAGVNPRLFADMQHAQATRNGADAVGGYVTAVEHAEGDGDTDADPRFVVTVEPDGDAPDAEADLEAATALTAEFVIAASWADASYLDPVAPETRSAGSKTFVREDGPGRTDVEGLYVAGRLAERYHQAVIAAGHGAQTALTLVHDSDVPFYHDWTVPEGYFTDRGREVPPGCEEIDETERRVRERESLASMREYFSEPHDERQRTHPSLVDDELGRVPDEED